LILAIAILCAGPNAGRAQPNNGLRASEQSVKAAYLYKFAGYVEWPDQPPEESRTPITIGVQGSISLADELTEITAGRTVNNRPIRVRRITAGLPLDDIQVLFIGAQERNRLDEALLPARQLPILTVTESEGALTEGSIINFTVDDQRVRFEISLVAAELNGLQLSSRLLDVAQRVYRSPE
jgi:hypothetical protein